MVLYFYPSDGSPGCTKQAAAFTESFGAFKKAGAVGRALACLWDLRALLCLQLMLSLGV